MKPSTEIGRQLRKSAGDESKRLKREAAALRRAASQLTVGALGSWKGRP